MGSIVGGLYSIGYDSHKLDSMVRCQDWSFLLTDKINRKNQNFEGRENQDTYFLSIPLRKKKRARTCWWINSRSESCKSFLKAHCRIS